MPASPRNVLTEESDRQQLQKLAMVSLLCHAPDNNWCKQQTSTNPTGAADEQHLPQSPAPTPQKKAKKRRKRKRLFSWPAKKRNSTAAALTGRARSSSAQQMGMYGGDASLSAGDDEQCSTAKVGKAAGCIGTSDKAIELASQGTVGDTGSSVWAVRRGAASTSGTSGRKTKLVIRAGRSKMQQDAMANLYALLYARIPFHNPTVEAFDNEFSDEELRLLIGMNKTLFNDCEITTNQSLDKGRECKIQALLKNLFGLVPPTKTPLLTISDSLGDHKNHKRRATVLKVHPKAGHQPRTHARDKGANRKAKKVHFGPEKVAFIGDGLKLMMDPQQSHNQWDEAANRLHTQHADRMAVALWDFEPQGVGQQVMTRGDVVQVLSTEFDGWWMVQRCDDSGQSCSRGWVPASYLSCISRQLAPCARYGHGKMWPLCPQPVRVPTGGQVVSNMQPGPQTYLANMQLNGPSTTAMWASDEGWIGSGGR